PGTSFTSFIDFFRLPSSSDTMSSARALQMTCTIWVSPPFWNTQSRVLPALVLVTPAGSSVQPAKYLSRTCVGRRLGESTVTASFSAGATILSGPVLSGSGAFSSFFLPHAAARMETARHRVAIRILFRLLASVIIVGIARLGVGRIGALHVAP